MEILGALLFFAYLVWIFKKSQKLNKEIHGKEKEPSESSFEFPEHFFDKKEASRLEQLIAVEKNSISSDFDLAKIEQNQEATQAFNVLLDTIRGGYIINTVSKTNFSDLEQAKKSRDLLMAHLVTQGVTSEETFKRVEFMFNFLDDNFDIMEQAANYGAMLRTTELFQSISNNKNLQGEANKLDEIVFKEKAKANKLLDFMHIMNKEFRVFIDCVR